MKTFIRTNHTHTLTKTFKKKKRFTLHITKFITHTSSLPGLICELLLLLLFFCLSVVQLLKHTRNALCLETLHQTKITCPFFPSLKTDATMNTWHLYGIQNG